MFSKRKRDLEKEENERMIKELELITKIVHLRLMRERDMMTVSQKELEKLK